MECVYAATFSLAYCLFELLFRQERVIALTVIFPVIFVVSTREANCRAVLLKRSDGKLNICKPSKESTDYVIVVGNNHRA